MSDYLVIYEPNSEGGWGAWLPDVDGVVAIADTRAEAEDMIKEALAMYFEDFEARGEAIPEPRQVAGYVSYAAA